MTFSDQQLDPGGATPPTRRGVSSGLVVVAWMIVAGVLLQAVIAGQAWFVSPGLFGLHGGIGHGVLLLAVIGAGLAWLRRGSPALLTLATVLPVALVGQTGLGYVGHRSGVALASSLHVPLGVSILGFAVALAVLATVGRRGAV